MNRLAKETSPYLKQHAHNPVDWYPWGEEAFQRARKEDKPILVSIGYSTCHWCHVMERESFENEDVASIMNANFINIKVDREERPDVDQIYMEAVQYLGVSGGWPLNCFLTPDRKPFFGGTYYPPLSAYNRPSWPQVLHHIRQLFTEKRNIVEEQAQKLTDLIGQSHDRFLQPSKDFADIQKSNGDIKVFKKINQDLQTGSDSKNGGFGGAPKFPSAMLLQSMLRWLSQGEGDESTRNHIILSLDKMALGGIFDHVGGGFSRYTVDAAWHIPHFEKMLYDNALLLTTYARANQLSPDPFYEKVIRDTFGFLLLEMSDNQGGFYAAYDADSEGVEGKYYVWDYEEFNKVIGESSKMLGLFYQVKENGNWEETNILHAVDRPEIFAEREGLDYAIFSRKIGEAGKILAAVRNERIKPGLDDKILTSWNALMSVGLIDAYFSLGDENILDRVRLNIDRLLTGGHDAKSGQVLRLISDRPGLPGFLDDYSYLSKSLIMLYRATGEISYLSKAVGITEYGIEHFFDKEKNLFYFTEAGGDAPVRTVELYDNATPSANSIMAENLFWLGKFFQKQKWVAIAHEMIGQLSQSIISYTRSFPHWWEVWMHMTIGNYEIAIVGPKAREMALDIQKQYGFHVVIAFGLHESEDIPLLRGREVEGETVIYICKDFECRFPVHTVKEALELLKD